MVVARAAREIVGTAATADDIVTGGRCQSDRHQIGGGPDRSISEFDPLNAHVRHRLAAEVDAVAAADDFEHHCGQALDDPQVGGRDAGRKLNAVGAVAVTDGVLAVAAGESVAVVARSALEQVVAAAANQQIGAVRAGE